MSAVVPFFLPRLPKGAGQQSFIRLFPLKKGSGLGHIWGRRAASYFLAVFMTLRRAFSCPAEVLAVLRLEFSELTSRFRTGSAWVSVFVAGGDDVFK